MKGASAFLYVRIRHERTDGERKGNTNPAADFTVACTHAVTKVRRSGASTKEKERNLGTACHFSFFFSYMIGHQTFITAL